MGNHRAHRGSRREVSATPVGRRKAEKPSTRHPLLRTLPSAPIVAGIAALAVSAGGAVTAADTDLAGTVTAPSSAMAAAGSSLSSVAPAAGHRAAIVSRDSRRDALADAANQKLIAKAEAQAEQQHAALEQFAKAAEKQAAKIKENQWVLPLADYRVSATFGASSYLWSTVHTGLDMSAPSGSTIMSVANGVVTEVGYDGSYGNKTVITLDDGTEIWYCHQTSFLVDVGDVVRGGQPIGTVGSTGNSTGPHLHLEVRPGAGDPVDPFTALLEHGVAPQL
ncbi:M23 family metallopeptidase [Nocardioides piscis]|uniref:M23 family metallopeptidase n=1 Tax=Nocardioides piscis TaxID=2714938 RepID=A0A6G7YFA7_9ACTN|nr:M23 family metallopeptidase [Nocardioides piscis]QIK75502.1 M23 family metallopeptidase [Nocardioides piscis]